MAIKFLKHLFTLFLFFPFLNLAAKDRAGEIAKMEKIADFALVTPKLNTSPLPKYDYDQLDYGMTIGIERTPEGRLWACWVAGSDSPEAFFVLATSDDDGETWSSPRVVIDTHSKDLPAERSTLVGNLWTDPLGRLWLFFDQSMDMFDGRAGVWAAICENPDADKPTWSKPKRIWHGVMLNKPIVLSNGEWMLPISLDQRTGFGAFKGCFKALDPLRGANVFVSSDEGKTWQRRGAVQFPNPQWHEHMVVERKDSTLWMLARTAKGIMESTSNDSGRTWSKPVPSKINHPVSRFHIRTLASGRLLLVKHGESIDQHQGRSQLSAWLSEDDGKTWKGGLMLDERKGISYPDGFQAPDGTIYISYDRNRATDGEILMARFNEDDILARKLTGPRSKLKMLISRPLAPKVAKLSPKEKQQGFKLLADGVSFTGWKHGGNWKIENGAFYRASKGGSLTFTEKLVPDDFELRFEWKVSKGCNSGVYYRPAQYEYQVLDNANSPYGENPRQAAASLFFCMAPSKDASKPFGKWNQGRIVGKGTVIQHWLNGEKVIDFDYTDPKWAKEIELLNIRGADLAARGGKLSLQDHGQAVWFRSIRMREIPQDEIIIADPNFRPMPVPPAALKKEQARVRSMLKKAAENQSDQPLLFSREHINRYSLDGLPRSISIRCRQRTWIGYDLERAKVYKVWELPKGTPALTAKNFLVKSHGTSLFIDKTKDVWLLQSNNKTVPLQARYLGCAQKKTYFELSWELKHEQDTFKLIERVSIMPSQPSTPVMRKLRIESLGKNQTLLPPKTSRKEWQIISGKGEEKEELSAENWYQLILR